MVRITFLNSYSRSYMKMCSMWGNLYRLLLPSVVMLFSNYLCHSHQNVYLISHNANFHLLCWHGNILCIFLYGGVTLNNEAVRNIHVPFPFVPFYPSFLLNQREWQSSMAALYLFLHDYSVKYCFFSCGQCFHICFEVK